MSLDSSTDELTSAYFMDDVVNIARDLVGRFLLLRDDNEHVRALIVETEAYGGPTDPASHAAFRPGGRASIMLAEAGLIYVYAAYGMYPCLNIVTGPVGIPSAVLVRGVWVAGDDRPTLGPGRTTRRLGVGMDDHGRSIGDGRFAVTASRVAIPTYETPRIGITRATEVLWRFVADVSSIEIP